MEITQESVRDMLIQYLNLTGVKQAFIADKVKLPTSVLSSFKHGKLDLWDSSLRQLYDFLKENK